MEGSATRLSHPLVFCFSETLFWDNFSHTWMKVVNVLILVSDVGFRVAGKATLNSDLCCPRDLIKTVDCSYNE